MTESMQKRFSFDAHQIQATVLNRGARRNRKPVSEMTAVADGELVSANLLFFAVARDPNSVCARTLPGFKRGDRVGQHSPSAFRLVRHVRVHIGAESEARDVQEMKPIYFGNIHQGGLPMQKNVARGFDLTVDTEVASEIVRRSQRNDAKGDLRLQQALDRRPDTAVAAADDHKVDFVSMFTNEFGEFSRRIELGGHDFETATR